MMIQGLLLVAVIAVISGTILTSTLVTAKTALHQTLAAQSRTAMSDATADFVTWAKARVQRDGAQTSWGPRQTQSLANDTSEFKPICDIAAINSANAPKSCDHWEHNTWVVTGATTPAGQPAGAAQKDKPPGTTVSNLARTVDEQRITAFVSADVESKDGRYTFASESRQVTARIFDGPPYVIITGVRQISSSNGGVKTAEGDSGGYLDGSTKNYGEGINSRPDPIHPDRITDTRIVTTVDCVNTLTASNIDPYSRGNEANALVIDVNRQGDSDWAYQMPCAPAYKTPDVPNKGYIAPVGTTYATVDDQSSQSELRRNGGVVVFPL
ncbi:MAG: hypothetical protein M3N13_07850 [Candidatus Eremiobacteraeota bacterium]|nr:hypothetical protein [Candidatus Eremiobacteraeota bacterium]